MNEDQQRPALSICTICGHALSGIIHALVSLCFAGFLAATHSSLAGPQATSSRVIVDRFNDVPVEMATGELKQYERSDFDIKSRGWRLQLGRNYQNQRDESGLFGYGWNWTHGDKLVFKDDWMIDYVTAESTTRIEPDVKYAESYAGTASGGSGWQQASKATG